VNNNKAESVSINLMHDLSPNTPVIVGVGFCQVKNDDPTQCPEPLALMLSAIRDAAHDAGAESLPTEFESIAVQRGSWKYTNPGVMLADALGCSGARSILADLGVLQLMPLFELCQAVAAGEQAVGVVTGGEARYRELRSLLTGQAVTDTEQADDTPPPDVFYETPDPFSSELEQQRGIWAPGEFYAIADSALRHHQGHSIEEHRDKIASLYSHFSHIAAENPHAWKQQKLAPEEIRNPAKKNAMIAFPYTKRMMSQWNVNQAVAIIVCSLARARQLQLDEAGWIYPVSAVQSRHVVSLAQKKHLHTHPGAVLTGRRALELAAVTTDDIAAVDLYSCFPSAIVATAGDLQLDDTRALSVTGSMAYAGGPYNHGALDSVARMVEVLRERTREQEGAAGGQTGLVTNISGMFGKQACALFSTQPNPQGFAFDDITETVAEQEIPLPLASDYVGAATIVGYSVMYHKADISHGIAFCDTPDGARTVVRTDDKQLAEQMTQQEFVGRRVQVRADGSFSMAQSA
jgi:acetyl-CoA C-acetyltransferase